MRIPPKPLGFQRGDIDAVTHDQRRPAAVLATYAHSDGAYTGSVTAGAPNFTGMYMSAYDMVLSNVDVDPSELPPGHAHGPYLFWDQHTVLRQSGQRGPPKPTSTAARRARSSDGATGQTQSFPSCLHLRLHAKTTKAPQIIARPCFTYGGP